MRTWTLVGGLSMGFLCLESGPKVGGTSLPPGGGYGIRRPSGMPVRYIDAGDSNLLLRSLEPSFPRKLTRHIRCEQIHRQNNWIDADLPNYRRPIPEIPRIANSVICVESGVSIRRISDNPLCHNLVFLKITSVAWGPGSFEWTIRDPYHA